jgi:hypothetical protein
VLRIVDRRQRAAYPGRDGRSRRTIDALTPDDVAEWMSAAGLDVRDGTDPQAIAVFTLIQNVACGGGALEAGSGAGRLSGFAKVSIQCSKSRSIRPLVGLAVLLPAALVWWVLIKSLRRSITGRRSGVRCRPADEPESVEQPA